MVDVAGKNVAVETELDLILQISRDTLIELVAVAQQLSGTFQLDGSELTYTYKGNTLRLANADELFSSVDASTEAVINLLNQDPAALLVLADRSGTITLDGYEPAFRDVIIASTLQSDGIERGAASETDTLNRHLDGLNSPSLYFSVNIEEKSFANLFARVDAGVGSDIGHLPPLPDEDYVRGFDPTIFPVLDEEQAPAPPKLVDDIFVAREDEIVEGDLSTNDTLPNPGTVYELRGEPPVGGTLTINRDGTFRFVPDDGASGEFDFTYVIKDGVAGVDIEGEAKITIGAIADAPSIVPELPIINGFEDVPVSFEDVSVRLEDIDGSEELDIRIEGVPPGANLSVGTEITPGIWNIPPQQFSSLVLTPPVDFNGTIQLELVATSTETTTGEQATTRTPLTIELAGVADPAAINTTPVSTSEDTPVNFGSSVTYRVSDDDGSEAVASVTVSNVPTGALLQYTAQGGATVTNTPNGVVITGSEADIRATVDTLAIQPALNNGNDFSLTVSILTRDAGGNETTVSTNQAVAVTDVADAPALVGGNFTTNEDTTVPLSGLSATLVDTDGSEQIAIVLSGVPTGAVLNAGTDLGGGRYALTPAELANLQFTPPVNAHGTYQFAIEATATDANGDTAVTTVPVGITVNAVADVAGLTTGTTAISEEGTANFGPGITFVLTDTDGSEVVSQVSLTGIPANVATSYTTAPGATVTAVTGGFEITGSPSAIRATLDSFNATNPTHNADDFSINVAVTTTDASGSTAVANGAHQIAITPVADAPTVSAASSTVQEDAPGVFGTGITYGLVDTDGSEVVSQVQVTGVPTGAAITYTAANGATVTAVSGGYSVTGSEAAIRATLDSFTYTSAANDDSDVQLNVAVTTRDANGDTATTNSTHDLAVEARADAVIISGSATGTEDTAIAVGVTATRTDTDGSESLVGAVVTAPVGVVLGGFTASGATVQQLSQEWRISGTEAQINQALADMTATPPNNSSANFALSIAVTSRETAPNGGQVDLLDNTSTFSVPVTVNADADPATVSNASSSVNEDSNVVFGTGITYSLTDTDGSESVTQVVLTGFPTGASVTQTPSGAAQVVAVTGGYRITGTPADIRATVNSFAITPAINDDTDIVLSVAVTTTDDNGDTAVGVGSHTINVSAVADAPSGSGSATGGEDTAIATPVTLTLADTDTSETITEVEITAPSGVVLGGFGPSGAGVAQIGQVWTITGTPAQITAAMSAMTATPPNNSEADFSLSIDITSTETNPQGGQVTTPSATGTIVVPVTVNAVADAPSLTGGTFATNEDVAMPLSSLAVAVADPSETITQIRISGVPAGGSLSAGTDLGGGIWQLTDAQLATVEFNPPANSHGPYTMSLSAIATEGSNGDTESASIDFTVNVASVQDTFAAAGNSTATDEDTPVLFGDQITWTLSDADGSESVTRVAITGLTGDAAMTYTAAAGAMVNAIAGGYEIVGTEAAIRATLDTFTYDPATHVGTDVSLTVDVTVTDASGTDNTESTTHFINVTPVADTPAAAGGTFTTNEDTPVLLSGIGGNLIDTDTSETASFVISNVPTGGSFSAGTDLGGGSWSFTAAQMTAGLSFTPPTDAATTYNMLLTMTATEAEGGTDTDDSNVVVTVTPVADAATVTTGTTNATEDTNILFGADITFSGNDTDNSETFSVTLSNIPTDATAFWNTGLPGTVTDNGGGSWTIDGTEAEVSAILATFGITPATHKAEDFIVDVNVTSIDGSDTETVNRSHAISFTTVADAPTVNATSSTVQEDVPSVFGNAISYSLVDTDTSEVISQVDVTDVPSGADISYTTAPGATVTAITGGYRITGDEAAIRTTLDSFAYETANNDDSEVQLDIAVTTREINGGDTATHSAKHDLTVQAVADPVTITGSGSGTEDTPIAVAVTANRTDTDGSESIVSAVVTAPTDVVLGGFGPSGATVVQDGQEWTITGTETQIQAALAAMTATPPANSDADFNLTVAVTSRETSPSGGEVAVLDNTTTVTNIAVTVAADADAPTATGPLTFNTEEDTPVSISALGGALTDLDGSETLSYRIEGVPTGATFNAGTNAGGGVWNFTVAQLAALTITPPDDWHGAMSLTLVSVATETSNSDTAETEHDFDVIVDAEADIPDLTPGISSTNEDIPVTFGDQITYASTDTVASESITQVRVYGVPNASLSYTAGGATVVQDGDGTKISGTESQIRTALNTLTYTPATHVGSDVNISVEVTVTDADGSTATRTGTHSIDVTPVADTPTASGDTKTTDEDVAVAVDLSGGLVDTDGSESISYEVTGVPNGASFSAGTNEGGGVWSFDTADLVGLMFSPPPQAHGTYNMMLRATATEDETGDPTTATATSALTITVNPVLDAPVINNGTSSGNEDTVINVGSDIDLTVADQDGSQDMTITLSGIPTGSTVDWNSGLPGTVTPSGSDWIVSGTTPEALALLDTLTVRPPSNSDANFTVGVSVYAEETGGANTTVSGSHQVNVAAVADAPNLSAAATITVDEDHTVGIPVTLSLSDADASETIQYVDISGIPSTATFSVTPSGAATFSTPVAGTVRVSGTTADIIATLASGLSITPPTNSDADIPLTITARSQESNPTETEVAVLNADTSINVTIEVNAVADGVTAAGGTFNIEEDAVTLLTGLGATLQDTDGSEVVTYRMLNVPAGRTFTTGTNVGSGVWTFTQAQIDAGISFDPPTHEHGTFDMTLEATTTETNGGANNVDTKLVRVVVDPQADAPEISGLAIGDEDTTITFGDDFAINLVDTDGSETLTQVVVTMPGTEVATYSPAGGASVSKSGQEYTITGTPAQIRAALDTFAWTPPAHSDDNILVNIEATTTDLDGSTATHDSDQTIRVRAVADAPGGTVQNITGVEDTAITLDINVTASADTDGSESYSVRIFDIPAKSIVAGSTDNGVTYTKSGDDWIVSAANLADINTALSTATFTPPADFSGTINAQIEIITTEGATGNEVAVPTASVTRSFDIVINQTADAPELRVVDATAGAAGYEDLPIRLIVDVRLADDDGSEVLSDITLTGVPSGARITNAAGVTLGTDEGGGTWTLTSAQLPDLHIIAPPDSNDDFQLTVSASSTESNQGLGNDGDEAIGSATIDVNVIGVADPANISASPISVVEDTTIPLGTAVGATLADTDTSESLFFVIEGLPAGTVPSAGTFIGGRWQVDAVDMPGLTIPAVPNFSGDLVADSMTGLKVFAVTQENDGDQTLVQVPLDITVTPIVDAASWSPAVTVTEDNDISLANAAPPSLIDNDGSEEIVSYTFDLTNLIADAQIASTGGTTANFIANHINGTFTDNGDNTITVLAANLPGVSFNAAAFADSNQDFTLPVAVVFTDGSATTTINNTYSVNLVGDADTPTVFASNVTGNDNTPLALSLGGVTTDTDTTQSRPDSESIYYIISGFANPGVNVVLTDGSGDPIGLNNQDGTWIVQPADLANLHITAIQGESGSKTLTVTTVATENDGDVALNSTTFDVTITATGGPGSNAAPLPPLVTINPMTVAEDGTIALDANITDDPTDTTTDINDVTVVITGVPAGVTVTGAIYNHVNDSWVTTAVNVNAGGVNFEPADDFSGAINFNVNAIATNGDQLSATNSGNPATINVTAVADEPSITVSGSGDEDSTIPLSITVASSDTDGSETLDGLIQVTLSAGTLSAGNNVGGNVWELTAPQLVGLTLTPPLHSNDDITVSVEATMSEPNGSSRTANESATIAVTAVADPANLTTSNSTGTEDSAIALTGLSATLVDGDGSESLSATITGVPEGSILSAGANNGDGSWTVAPADLAGLQITPPMNWSGTMNLALVAFTLEATGQTSSISQAFTVTIEPEADPVVFVALPQETPGGTFVNLGLDLQPGDATGTDPGENPAEIITVTLQASDDFIATSTGGTLTRVGQGSWTFTGTAAEGNTLSATAFGEARDIDISVGVNATDGASVGTVSTVVLPLSITGAGASETGTSGADTITGTTGSDLIIGGGGIDALTGGGGADMLVWRSGDAAGGADTLSDFAADDVLDLGDLISSYDPSTDSVADFIELVEASGNTTVRIDTGGTGNHSIDVVELTGVTGLDLSTLIASGAVVV